MNRKLEMAQDKFIESIGKLCGSFGLNKFVAQLYAVLYLSNKPLSLDEMAEELEVSKGSVSINIRELEKWGAVKNIWVKGSRKDYYEAELDIKKVFANKLRSAVQKRIAEVSNMTDEFKKITKSAATELTDEEKVIAQVYEERLKKIEELKAMAATALSLAEKFLQ
ncbi:MAG: HTH domain-containing protein [Candidatus Omnitrophota bacterium]|nr:HTH domain-containing protein [Candidatus Omnitrophota bacterium]